MPGDEPNPKRFRAVHLSLPQAHPYTPEAYLDDAADALRNCGNPVVLYDPFIVSGVTRKVHVELMLAQAGQTLIRQATAGVLFCAFAAEAYVNRFLAAMLSKADFAAVDRLATVDKYVIAVPRADPDIGSLLGLDRRFADVHYPDPVFGRDILAIWQPGDPEYDRHTELPR